MYTHTSNRWQFTSDNQPTKPLSRKQSAMRIREILSMTVEELEYVSTNLAAPAVFRMAARSILDGEPAKVVQLLNLYEHAD